MLKFKLLFVVLLFLFGCITNEKLISHNSEPIINFTKYSFDGIYSNKDSLQNSSLTLWDLLERNISKSTSIIKNSSGSENLNQENMTVKLILENDEDINVQLLQKDSVVKEMSFKGNIIESYFCINRHYLLIPIPFFYFRVDVKNILGISNYGDLVVVHRYRREGWFLFMAGDVGGTTKWHFKRL